MFDPLPPVLAWARSLYDEGLVNVNVRREEMTQLGAGPWISIDLPEASFARARAGRRPEAWNALWTVDIHFGSGRFQPSPEVAWSVVWDMASPMIGALTSQNGLDIPRSYLVAPENFRQDERWNEGDVRGQLTRTLTISISTRSAN